MQWGREGGCDRKEAMERKTDREGERGREGRGREEAGKMNVTEGGLEGEGEKQIGTGEKE